MDLNTVSENIKATGQVHIVRMNSEGCVIEERKVKNLVVTAGKNYIAQKMVATTNTPTAMTHMAIGTNSTPPLPENTTLGGQTTRQLLTGNSVTANSITYTANFPAGQGDGAITEAGIFNAATNGDMLCRTVFPVVNKGSGDIISITWVITVS